MPEPKRTIYDIPVQSRTITLKGVQLPIYKIGARRLAGLARRFPDAEFLQQLTKPQAEGQESTFELKDADVIVAMAAAALGYMDDPDAEDHLEEAIGMEGLGEVITVSMELSGASADEGFGKRSA